MSHKNRTNPFHPLVSIIIPSHQRFDLLQQCLDAIPAALGDLPYEVLLIENGSPKAELDKFLTTAQFPPHTTPTYWKDNQGFGAACNYAARHARGVLLFFLNNDVILDPGSVVQLVKNMDDPGVGIAGMKLVFPSEQALNQAQLKHSANQRTPGKIQHVGLFTSIGGQIGHMYIGWSEDNPRVNALREVFAVTGAALMCRRKFFLGVGGFDPRYLPGTYEDVDLCMKAHQQALHVVVDVLATGQHYAGATSERYNMYFPLNENLTKFHQRWSNQIVWTDWLAW